MATYDIQRSHVSSEHVCRTHCAVLMINAVKPVAANASFHPFKRSGVNVRVLRKSFVEASIEDCDLRFTRKEFFCRLDPFESYDVVEWRNFSDARDGGFYVGINQGRIGQLRPAMYDSMTQDINLIF